MKLRVYAAVVTGALAELTTLCGLYLFTNMELGGIILCAVWAYIFNIIAVMYITEPRIDREEKPRRREFKVYDLKAETQYELEEETA